MNRKKTAMAVIGCLLAAVAASAATAGEASPRCEEEIAPCVRKMMQQVRDKGWVGIEFEDADPPVINRVVSGSPAEQAGIRPGDRWIGVGEVRFAGKDRKELLAGFKADLLPGRTVTFVMERAGRELRLDVELVAVPRHILAQWIGQHLLEMHAAEIEPVTADAGAADEPAGERP